MPPDETLVLGTAETEGLGLGEETGLGLIVGDGDDERVGVGDGDGVVDISDNAEAEAVRSNDCSGFAGIALLLRIITTAIAIAIGNKKIIWAKPFFIFPNNLSIAH